ncbi:Os10g0412800 [Oryza sativa Japonica Group]|uniref:Os10g0412800 protein n=1 Tax=Oryza sativa subsp. japonica TaxID=39947 RepID=C7J7Y2_ORYSJ|nr:Os10g0412800 [Oryza sativa Japonica Group]|eukprot:NP_001176147.1 Os10g0412800 [Oryza sativa Japonica Group]
MRDSTATAARAKFFSIRLRSRAPRSSSSRVLLLCWSRGLPHTTSSPVAVGAEVVPFRLRHYRTAPLPPPPTPLETSSSPATAGAVLHAPPRVYCCRRRSPGLPQSVAGAEAPPPSSPALEAEVFPSGDATAVHRCAQRSRGCSVVAQRRSDEQTRQPGDEERAAGGEGEELADQAIPP